MRFSNAQGSVRIAAGALCALLAAALLFSAFFAAAEADHDCSGEDCPVCACVRMCERTLRGLGGGRIVLLSCAAPAFFLFFAAAFTAASFPRETPVSGKVRLNN